MRLHRLQPTTVGLKPTTRNRNPTSPRSWLPRMTIEHHGPGCYDHHHEEPRKIPQTKTPDDDDCRPKGKEQKAQTMMTTTDDSSPPLLSSPPPPSVRVRTQTEQAGEHPIPHHPCSREGGFRVGCMAGRCRLDELTVGGGNLTPVRNTLHVGN